MSLHYENQLGRGLVLTSWMERFPRFHGDGQTCPEKFLESRAAGETRASLPSVPVFSSEPWFDQLKVTRKVQWRWSGYAVQLRNREAETQREADWPCVIHCPGSNTQAFSVFLRHRANLKMFLMEELGTLG